MLDELLKKLGVSEQIDFVVKRKNSAIPRTEWNQIYEQILGFLDMEQSVTKESLLVLNSLELDDQTVLVTNQGDYYTRLQNTYFTNWMSAARRASCSSSGPKRVCWRVSTHPDPHNTNSA